jgi:ATP/maltotriose-dependent transcriptional regulator MalT/DNA-binding SARP family transcriptional activator
VIDSLPLLTAKLLPPDPGPAHLPRPRLHRRLTEALEGKATVLLAGPGYGKTALVARFLREKQIDSVWVSLDPADADPRVLFRYLTLAFREQVPEFGEKTAALGSDPRTRSEPVDRLADLFLCEAEESLGGRFLLVLDGVHHLGTGAADPCVRALRRLLAYLPGTLHLVLIGRVLPDLGIPALTAEGSAATIPGEALLFTPEETRNLLREVFGWPVGEDVLARVQSRTRGWVTALQFLRQNTRLRESMADLPEEVFVRTETEIFEYFSEEVLAAEPEAVRGFLLGTSPPEVIDPDLCAEALPGVDVRGILDGLLRRRLFVSPLESRAEYFSYDPLFRDFLRRKLDAAPDPESRRGLHRRYAKAHARRGDFARALAHGISAEDAPGIAEILGRHGRMLLAAGYFDAVRRAIEHLDAAGSRSPLLEDLRGEACRMTGDYSAAVGHFERALSAPVAERPRGMALPGRADTLQGLAYSLLKLGDAPRAGRVGEEALSAAAPGDRSLRARILNTLSLVRLRENRGEEAIGGFREALALARQAGDDPLTRVVAHNLGLPHAVRGDFDRASECFGILVGPDAPAVTPHAGAARLNLARIETIRGEYPKAASLLGDAREIASKLRLRSLAGDVLEAEGILLRETGELESARERFHAARALFTELGLLDTLDGIEEEEAILLARTGQFGEANRRVGGVLGRRRAAADAEGTASALLATGEIRALEGRDDSAREALREAIGFFSRSGRRYEECVASTWLALAAWRAGEKEEARKHALAAIEISSAHDYRAAVIRIADRHPPFRRWLAALPSAASHFPEPSARTEPAARPPRLPLAGRPDLSVRLLGPVEVSRDEDVRIPARAWKIRRAMELFCLLSASRDHRVTKDRLVEALWRDARLAAIEKNFHPTISCLRRALNHGRGVDKHFILFEKGAYLLNPAYRYDIDVERFERAIRSAREQSSRGDAPGALAAYAEALELYRGPFLEESYEEWTEAPRTHYETLHTEALFEAGELHLQLQDPRPGAACFRKILDRDSTDEEASARLMACLGALGDRTAVEKEYRRLAGALREDLDSEPLPETERAYRRALAGSAPAASPRVAPFRRKGARSRGSPGPG